MNYPLINIPIVLQRDSAWWIECVVKIIDLLDYFADDDNIFQRCLLDLASTLAKGSSKNSKVEFPIKAMHTHNFLLFPPLKVQALWFLYSVNWRFLI